MKIIFIIPLLGIISCLNNLPIADVYYNYDYNLTKDYSSSYSQYFFRAMVIPGQKIDIELKFEREEFFDNNYFNILVMEFNNCPSNDDIYNHQNYQTITQLHGDSYYMISNFVVQPFRYNTNNNYLGIIVFYGGTFRKLSFLNFRIDVSKYYYSDIEDLTYNTNYTVDVGRFYDFKIPMYYQTFIRIHNQSVNEMEIQLTTHEGYKNDSFKVDVCEYKEMPTQAQVYYGHGAEKCVYNLENFSDDDKEFKYMFTKDENISYLTIGIINQASDLNYLNIFIYHDEQPEPTSGPTGGPSDTPDGKGGSSEINHISNILMDLLFLFIL